MKKRSDFRWLSTEEIMDTLDAMELKIASLQKEVTSLNTEVERLESQKLDSSYMIDRGDIDDL